MDSTLESILSTYVHPEDANLAPCESLARIASRITEDLRNAAPNPSHWDEIPGYPWKDWREEVYNNDTRLGYEAWAQHREEMEKLENGNSQDDPVFYVAIREEIHTRIRRAMEVVDAGDAKKAFKRVFQSFMAESPAERDRKAEMIHSTYEIEVETPDGDIYIFTDADDDEEPFNPENHQSE